MAGPSDDDAVTNDQVYIKEAMENTTGLDLDPVPSEVLEIIIIHF